MASQQSHLEQQSLVWAEQFSHSVVRRQLETMNDTYTASSGTDGDDYYDATIDSYYNNKWLLIVPRVTAFISLLAVTCVAMEAWYDLRQVRTSTRTTTAKNVSTITHIQFFYQIPLFCHALVFTLGTTAAPQGQAWGAVGNIATCSVQGFLMQMGVYGTVLWDAALSTAYILMVRYKVAEVQLQSYKKYLHLFIWPICLGVSIYPLTQQMYNLNGTVCWLESYPNNCEGDQCQRGEGAVVWQTAASIVFMLHLLYSISVMFCLYCAIRGLENHTSDAISRDHMSVATSASPQRRYSKAIRVQGMLYASGMLLVGLPTPVYIMLWNTAGLWNNGFSIFATSMLGFMGYVNFVIFMRKRSVEQCHTRYAKLLRRAHSWLFDSNLGEKLCYPCLSSSDQDIEQPTATPTPTRISSPRPRRSRSVSPAGPGQQRKHRAQQPKPGLFEEIRQEQDLYQPGASTHGAWTGFLVKVKDRGTRLSQWVSELGASRMELESESSGNDSWSETHGDDASRDNPPSRPMRLHSHVEEASHASKVPPCKPMRCRSEVEPFDDGDSLARSARTAPPTLPIRYTSEVETQVERPPRIPERYSSEFEQSSPEAPPTQPVRYVSEVQDLSESESSHRVHVGHVGPPSKPLRYESELELESSFSLSNSSGQLALSDHDSSFVRRQTAPPTRPLRLLSEVEEDSNRHNGSSALLPLDAISEHSHSTDNTHPKAPAKPERCVGEVEVEWDDSDLSGNGSIPRESSNQSNCSQSNLNASNPGAEDSHRNLSVDC